MFRKKKQKIEEIEVIEMDEMSEPALDEVNDEAEAVDSEEDDDELEAYQLPNTFSYRHPGLYGILFAVLTCAVLAGMGYAAIQLIPPDLLPWVRELVLDAPEQKNAASSPIEEAYDGGRAKNGNVSVPDLSGRTKEEAVKLLNSLELGAKFLGETVSNSDAGTIVDQEPLPKDEVPVNTTVFFHTSIGPSSVTVPDIVGHPYYEASNLLEIAGIGNITVIKEHSKTTKAGVVTTCNPQPGSTISTADPVAITVSAGQEGKTAKASDYINMSSDEALSASLEDGFVPVLAYGNSSIVEEGHIMYQTVEKGQQCPSGTDIVLTVSNGAPPEAARTLTYELEEPLNATEAAFRFVFVQESPECLMETVVEEGDMASFPKTITVPDMAGTGAGIIRYDEKLESGNWVQRSFWEITPDMAVVSNSPVTSEAESAEEAVS